MLNHFRTLLLNLSYNGDPTEHIPEDFRARTLTPELDAIHKLLFPVDTSRYYKLFLAHCYLQVIKAAGLDDELKSFDPRISYSLDYSDFFKIQRHSNPAISSTSHPIFIQGSFRGNETGGSFYDSYLITQVDNLESVYIYSKVKKHYIKENLLFEQIEDAAKNNLTFTNGVSAPVIIGSSGITFSLGGGDTFADSANKTWEFLVEGPYSFDLLKKYNTLKLYNTSVVFKGKNPTKFENLWKQHFNPIYGLAGFLISFITAIN